MEMKEVSPQEARIRALTRIYYSKPAVQAILLEFAKDREVVPRYFEGFGKRPDTLQYTADIMGLVQRGATSFHGSEELWTNPLDIQSDMNIQELGSLRRSWDLLIDIDSPYFDYSKVAARLVLELLERYGIKNYGIKFSGGKGFHIIVPGESFPEEYEGALRKDSFPEWPRAITEFVLASIRPEYNKAVTALGFNIEALERKTNLSREELVQTSCPQCGRQVEKKTMVRLECDVCKTKYERPNMKITKRKLKCLNERCPGSFDVKESTDFWYCAQCKISSLDRIHDSSKKIVYNPKALTNVSSFEQEIAGDKLGSLDLVLVSSRHLFRMPYSLHEKTALASIVLSKSQIASFVPKDADPLHVLPIAYYQKVIPGEGASLLKVALESSALQKGKIRHERSMKGERESVALTGVTDDMFPDSIRILLKGLTDGRKRGLFVLLTFLKCTGFSHDAITARVFEWNEKNKPPLKEGYVQSQLNWHFKQRKNILPPNYENQSFYKDLGLITKKPEVKNPLVEVMRKMKGR